MIKILNVNLFLDSEHGGGTAERTFQISRAFSQAGERCSILTTNIGLKKDRIDALGNVKVVDLPCFSDNYYFPKIFLKQLRNLIKDHDIIHLMNHWSPLNAIVYLLARRLKIPYAVCPAGALPKFGRSKLIKGIYNSIIGKKIIKHSNAHIAIAINEIEHFKTYGIDKQRVTIIPNGISPDDFSFDGTNPFNDRFKLKGATVIMFMGRLNYIKGPDLLIHAYNGILEKYPNSHLVFAGPDDGMLYELKELVTEHKMNNNVHFVGYLDGLSKNHAYNAADMIVIPSRQEAMSIVVLEAGITKTPVLITDQCGFNDIEDVRGGFVVPATVSGIEKGLESMLVSQDRLDEMGNNLQDYVKNNYTWDKVIKKYIELYRNIIDKTEKR